MVERQIERRGVSDPKVLAAMQKIPRHLFVPGNMISSAYMDEPLPIGNGQTISQPYIVAYMTEALKLKGEEKVLEVGTGSGYQAAVLAEIAAEVYTVELIEELSNRARSILENLGYRNIFYKTGDGTRGWEKYAPYDAIIVTAAPAHIPKELKRQLKHSGRMVIPVGTTMQELYLVIRKGTGFKKNPLLPVRFVPLISVQ
ncbi:MAG: protein-L-isoaspartate(D-aspartate) O-methyltransferase [Candidatus Aminicenantes bacterium]|nr:protein-L-isoaspartate(D-aspartate) O-methyltransferase [Candidatus Aminicenantes bacterium]